MFIAFPWWLPPHRRLEVTLVMFPERGRWGWVFHESERWLRLGWAEVHLPFFERF